MNTDYQSSSFRRQFIDIAPLFAVAAKCWREYGMRSNVRVEKIQEESLPRVWTHPESVFRILNRFVMDSIDASIDGSIVEIALKSADADGEWLAFTVRDWSGGKPEGWAIDPAMHPLAKNLEGYMDVAIQAGRGTVCSLHLPSGSLQGWLFRQSHSAQGYHISWNAQEMSLGANNNEHAMMDEALQLSLQTFGSIIPLGGTAYLLATPAMIDVRAIELSIAKRLPCNLIRDKRWKTSLVRVEYFGRMGEFIHRLESEIPTSTCDFTVAPAANPSESIVRFDSASDVQAVDVDRVKRPNFVKLEQSRIHPRRVRSTSD